MAKKSPATIKYKVEGEEANLGFHSVIVEAHTASTEITKFPVQTGFEISNHAIRKNRTISIEAIVTNTPMTHQGIYGSGVNNSRDVFNIIESIVNSATPCTVVTNLGIYKYVVFNKFNTKQQQGMTDAIRFTLSGEEIQIADAIAKTVPTTLSFTKLEGAEKETKCAELIDKGTIVVENIVTNETIEEVTLATGESTLIDTNGKVMTVDKLKQQASSIQAKALAPLLDIKESVASLGESFAIPSLNFDGSSMLTTYVASGYNMLTDSYSYAVNLPTEAIKMVGGAVGSLSGSSGFLPKFDGNLLGGLSGVSSCLAGKAGDYVNDKLNELTDTALGKLRETAHGVVSDIIELGNGNPILGAALDCVGEEVSDRYGSGRATTAHGAVDDIIRTTRRGVRTNNKKVTNPIREMKITQVSPKLQTVK